MTFNDKQLAMANANFTSRYIKGIRELPLLYNFVGDGSGLTAAGSADASGEFDPTDITGLQLWLDADDIDTLFTESTKGTQVASDGDPVGAWDDKSGNNKDAIQATGVNRPTYKAPGMNGVPSLLWDGVNDYMENTFQNILSGNEAFTVFVVSNDNNDGGTHGGLLAIKRSNFWHALTEQWIGGQSKFFIITDGINGARNAWIADARTANQQPHISVWQSAGTNEFIRFRINKAQQTINQTTGVINANGSAGYFLGRKTAGNNVARWEGFISEYLVYNADLTSDEVDDVEAYLSTKWGTP